MDREPWESINACLKENGRLLNENIRLVEINAALLEALEAVGAAIHDHKTEPAVVWVDSATIAGLTPMIRAAIAQAKGESK